VYLQVVYYNVGHLGGGGDRSVSGVISERVAEAVRFAFVTSALLGLAVWPRSGALTWEKMYHTISLRTRVERPGHSGLLAS
jgi:hypothetical protein